MADYSKTINFIKDLYGNQEFTPLAVPVFAGNEKKYLNECIDTTFVSLVDKFVDRFEEDMANYTGAKRAVVCVSGTNALHMSLLLVGVTQVVGDFEKDDIVRIVNEEGRLLGVGCVGYGSEEARALIGSRDRKPLVHYDYLYID